MAYRTYATYPMPATRARMTIPEPRRDAGPALVFSPDDWHMFTAALRGGEFDLS